MTVTDALPEMERELKFYPSRTNQPKKLTRQQVCDFNKNGYVFPLDVFSAEEVVANRDYFDDLMDRAKSAGHNGYAINGWHYHCRGICDLLFDNRILDYVEDLLGPNLVNTMTHYFCKEPGDDRQVVWHQDASYWPLTPSKTVTVWLAIDDADKDNGAMRFVPGSHLHGQIPFEHSKAEEQNVLGQSVPDAQQWGRDPATAVLKAGQISIHTDLLLHGSGYNISRRRRCGLTLRYMPPDVRTGAAHGADGFICRGNDPSGYWVDCSRPSGDCLP